jgi:hypothetical protein
MATGEGYDLCREVCGQDHHAEVAACLAAGTGALGGTLYLHGHSYLCDPCRAVAALHGIIDTVIIR